MKKGKYNEISIDEKENLIVSKLQFKSNYKTDYDISYLKDKNKIRQILLEDLEEKLKLFFNQMNINDSKTKSEITYLTDRLEEEILKNEKISNELSNLQEENNLLGEIIEKLKQKANLGEIQENKFERPIDYNKQIDELNKELEEYKKKFDELEDCKRVIEELKKEKDKLIIEIEKEKSNFDSRINDLKEQIMLKDKKIEEIITSEVSNKQITNQNIKKITHNVDKWKKLYMIEAKNLINLQKNYKSIIEDSKCHVELIVQLESKLQKQEAEYFHLYTEYHQKLMDYRIENLKNMQIQLDLVKNTLKAKDFEKVEERMTIYALEHELAKEKEKICDYKVQINLLTSTKEDLQRNLCIARHNIIELTEKLDDECSKVSALEDMRISDIQYISSLEEEF